MPAAGPPFTSACACTGEMARVRIVLVGSPVRLKFRCTSGAVGGAATGGGSGFGEPMSVVLTGGSAVTTGVTSRTGSILMLSCGFGSMMRSVILLVPPGSSHTVVFCTDGFDGSNGVDVPGAWNDGFGTFATSTVCVCDFSVHSSAIGV